jgi:hypothetical protein
MRAITTIDTTLGTKKGRNRVRARRGRVPDRRASLGARTVVTGWSGDEDEGVPERQKRGSPSARA